MVWPGLLKNLWGLVITPLIVLTLGLIIEYWLIQPVRKKENESSNVKNSAQISVTENGASGTFHGPGYGSAKTTKVSTSGGSGIIEPGESRIEILDKNGGKRIYVEKSSSYRYEIPKSEHIEHSAEVHLAFPDIEILAEYDENQARTFAREIAKRCLQPGERLIKSIIGKSNYTQNILTQKLSSDDSISNPPWHCIVLTQANLLDIGIDEWERIVTSKRYPFQQVKKTEYFLGGIADRFYAIFFTGDTLNLDVPSSFRKQAQDIVSVFNRDN